MDDTRSAIAGITRRNVPVATAVGLVIGGSVGNVVDRLFRNDGWFDGAVVDFIDLQWWPIFNVADIGIVGDAVEAAALLAGELERLPVSR